MPRSFTRRKVIESALAVGPLACSCGMAGQLREESANPIERENQNPGTRDWMIEHVAIDTASKYRSPRIEGYASRTDARAGDSVTFHVSTNPARRFRAELFRLGYYQGMGGRIVRELGVFAGEHQAEPVIGPKRLRECSWPAGFELTVLPEWTSGVYLVKLTTEETPTPAQSYIVFIVSDDREADFLFQCSDTTWNAYNRWPNQFALYDDGVKQWYWGGDVQVSFDRPYGKYCQVVDAPLSTGSGEFLLWEFPVAYWLERERYDITYISNLDTHSNPETLKRAKALLSVGHDEYWSLAMYENIKQAIASGLSVAFLCGNAICGVVEISPSSDGRPNRIIERVGLFGGVDDTAEGFPDMANLTRHGPSESRILGARNMYPVTGGADWTCVRPDHWLFSETGMNRGDSVPGLVGWEWHGDPAELPGLEVVATGVTKNSGNVEGRYAATLYPGPKGNLVFNASTIWWGDGLSEPPGYVRPAVYTKPQGPDPRVQTITRNLLERMRQGKSIGTSRG